MQRPSCVNRKSQSNKTFIIISIIFKYVILIIVIFKLKNWFGTRRRHDLKEGKLCRHCRFFKAPVSEEAHNWYGSRPCVTYWKLPTVAPPPIVQTTSLPMTSMSSGDVSSTMDESIDEKPDHQTVRDKIDEDMPTYFNDGAAAAVAPTAFSLAFQPGTYNFQQPIFNFEVFKPMITPTLSNNLNLVTFCSRMIGISSFTTDNSRLI